MGSVFPTPPYGRLSGIALRPAPAAALVSGSLPVGWIRYPALDRAARRGPARPCSKSCPPSSALDERRDAIAFRPRQRPRRRGRAPAALRAQGRARLHAAGRAAGGSPVQPALRGAHRGEKELIGLYQTLGEVISAAVCGWTAFVFTGNANLARPHRDQAGGASATVHGKDPLPVAEICSWVDFV